MMNRLLPVFAFALLPFFTLSAAPAATVQSQAPSHIQLAEDLRFSQRDVRIITDVLGAMLRDDEASESSGKKNKGKKDKANKGKKAGGLPPGLAKREQLPPGLQKQIQRKGTLPPGLQTHPLPVQVERELGQAPKGTKRVVVGTDVILMEIGTKIILDVIKDVLR